VKKNREGKKKLPWGGVESCVDHLEVWGEWSMQGFKKKERNSGFSTCAVERGDKGTAAGQVSWAGKDGKVPVEIKCTQIKGLGERRCVRLKRLWIDLEKKGEQKKGAVSK